MKKTKLFNDPIYGFISVKNPLVFQIIEHPYFQRLRRISQMGLSYLVYPGAHHTRFQHVIGCTFLMQKAVEALRLREVEISGKEEEALIIAILLHDLGHGPYSHALEGSFLKGVGHEEISLQFMHALNKQFNGQLDLAIQMFKGEYHRPFMNELISSQLDMDRLDYLKRDSFYSGVAEGNLNAERMISMLCVREEHLAVEHKGIYSVEKFIMARRFMYWQVYLHKTGLAAENILVKIILRVRDLLSNGIEVEMSPILRYFLEQDFDAQSLNDVLLNKYAQLDDADLIQGMKAWTKHDDFILSYLSKSIINRKLPKIEMSNEAFGADRINKIRTKVKKRLEVSDADLDYLVYTGKVSNQAYTVDSTGIRIAFKNGETKDLKKASDQGGVGGLNHKTSRYFLCYPKKRS